MWLCILMGKRFEKTYGYTQWRKLEQMQFEKEFENTQRRKVKQMIPKWLCNASFASSLLHCFIFVSVLLYIICFTNLNWLLFFFCSFAELKYVYRWTTVSFCRIIAISLGFVIYWFLYVFRSVFYFWFCVILIVRCTTTTYWFCILLIEFLRIPTPIIDHNYRMW